MRKSAFILVMVAVAAFVVAQPVSAAATSSVEDPAGDAVFLASPLPAPGYQDIIQATVTLDGGQFTFGVKLAAPIPDTPALAPGVRLMVWSWGVDTNPTTAPSGFPFVQGPEGAAPAEFLVWVIWDGTSFTGVLIDRRPLLTGGDAIITPISFARSSAGVAATLGATSLSNPSAFRWRTRTIDWLGPLGSLGNFDADRAPNAAQATWSS